MILRLRPDGTSTLTSTIHAVAKTDFNMRRYPFDSQGLEAVFEVVGFDKSEVVLEADPCVGEQTIHISRWDLRDIKTAIRHRNSLSAGPNGCSTEFALTFVIQRKPLFIFRLVGMPLALIVMLSWSVFWMERSSLGDRISVSFVGILTAVTYQIVVGDFLPHASYITVMHAFLTFSLLLMCASVVINLVVGACDKNGKSALGDLIDRRCRWIFPFTYLIMLGYIALYAFFWF